jgi:hypothetical protein
VTVGACRPVGVWPPTWVAVGSVVAMDDGQGGRAQKGKKTRSVPSLPPFVGGSLSGPGSSVG